MAATFPSQNWQFWAATILFAAALVWLLRGLLPERLFGITLRRKHRGTRASLTIGGERMKK